MNTVLNFSNFFYPLSSPTRINQTPPIERLQIHSKSKSAAVVTLATRARDDLVKPFDIYQSVQSSRVKASLTGGTRRVRIMVFSVRARPNLSLARGWQFKSARRPSFRDFNATVDPSPILINPRIDATLRL